MAHHVCKASQNKKLQFTSVSLSLWKRSERETSNHPLAAHENQHTKPRICLCYQLAVTAVKQQCFPSQIYDNWQLERVCHIFLNTHRCEKNKNPDVAILVRKSISCLSQEDLIQEISVFWEKSNTDSLSNKIISLHSMVQFEALPWKIMKSLI